MVIIADKKDVSREQLLDICKLMDLENLRDKKGVPDKYDICQYLSVWSEFSETPISDLLYVMDRCREMVMVQSNKMVDRAGRIVLGVNNDFKKDVSEDG